MAGVEGKSALVTGGLGAIGQAIALRFGLAGARVTISDLAGGAADEALAMLESRGVKARFLPHDVTSEADWAGVSAAIVEADGRFDILVNNAGVAAPPPDGFETIDYAEWRRIMSVNLDGTFLGTQAAVRCMKHSGGGAIVNIGSVAAYIGTPGGAAYGASKGGVRTMTKQAAVACAKRGYNIRINAVHPSYVWTPLVAKNATERWGEDAKERIRATHPFGCLAEPDDVAHAVLFLASDEARMINGADLVLDGGAIAQ